MSATGPNQIAILRTVANGEAFVCTTAGQKITALSLHSHGLLDRDRGVGMSNRFIGNAKGAEFIREYDSRPTSSPDGHSAGAGTLLPSAPAANPRSYTVRVPNRRSLTAVPVNASTSHHDIRVAFVSDFWTPERRRT